MPDETVVHEFPLKGAEHFVTQVGRSVQVFERREGDPFNIDLTEPVKVFTLPEQWGDRWGWNLREDGDGIVFTHTT